MSVHVQMMRSWICQGDENVCLWMYKHTCMCIRTCMCKSGLVQIIVLWISQQQSECSQQTCDALAALKVKSRRGASVRFQPCRRVGPNTALLQGLGLDLVLYKFGVPGPRFLKPHTNHMKSHLHIILYSNQTMTD